MTTWPERQVIRIAHSMGHLFAATIDPPANPLSFETRDSDNAPAGLVIIRAAKPAIERNEVRKRAARRARIQRRRN
ncbi:MAG: hypothetical protein AAFR88_12395, partial [Pseudomonadota bacterium]